MSTALNVMDTTSLIFIWVLILGLVCGIILFVFYWFSFNIKTRLRYLTSTFDQIIDTKSKQYKDKEGNEKILIRLSLFKRQCMPLPPAKAIGLSKNGKRCFDIEVSDDGNWRYIVKETSTQQFKPFNTNDRVFHINEFDKRQSRKKRTFSELILALAPMLSIIIILGLLLGFWGDVVKPFTEAQHTTLQITNEQKEITMLLKEIIKKEQIISSEPNNNGAPPD